MKILIIKTSSMGDVIHTLPAISDAKTAFPEIQIDWVVEEAFAEIPRMHKAVNRVLPLAFRRWRKHMFASRNIPEIKFFFRALRESHYDLVIDAQGLIKSAILTLCAHGMRCGFDKNSAREVLAACCYQRKFAVAKNQHAITRVRALLASALNYSLPSSQPNYGINRNDFLIADREENYLVFIHGSSRNDKCWHENNWVELAKTGINKGFKVYLPWGSDDEFKRAERITAISPRVKILPRSNLVTIASLLAGAKGVVAVDTGLGHLAAALSVPTVSLYGPTNVELIGTWGKNQKHMLHFETVTSDEVWRELEQQLKMKN